MLATCRQGQAVTAVPEWCKGWRIMSKLQSKWPREKGMKYGKSQVYPFSIMNSYLSEVVFEASIIGYVHSFYKIHSRQLAYCITVTWKLRVARYISKCSVLRADSERGFSHVMIRFPRLYLRLGIPHQDAGGSGRT
jgi:hypothetical protein